MLPISNGRTPVELHPESHPESPALLADAHAASSVYRVRAVERGWLPFLRGHVAMEVRWFCREEETYLVHAVSERAQLRDPSIISAALHHRSKRMVEHAAEYGIHLEPLGVDRLTPLLFDLTHPLSERAPGDIDPSDERFESDVDDLWRECLEPRRLVFEDRALVDGTHVRVYELRGWPTELDGETADELWRLAPAASLAVERIPSKVAIRNLRQRVARLGATIEKDERCGNPIDFHALQKYEDGDALLGILQRSEGLMWSTTMSFRVHARSIPDLEAESARFEARLELLGARATRAMGVSRANVTDWIGWILSPTPGDRRSMVHDHYLEALAPLGQPPKGKVRAASIAQDVVRHPIRSRRTIDA